MWLNLFNESLNVEHSLGGIKRTFTEVRHLSYSALCVKILEIAGSTNITCVPQITRGEIMSYRSEIEDFAKRFYSEGPGSVGEDLDKGKIV
jgi:hypothetical protein